jgi:hypothetical protein
VSGNANHRSAWLLTPAANASRPRWATWLDAWFGRLAKLGGKGYVDAGNRLKTGHVFALLLFVVLVLLHFGLAFISYPLPRGFGFAFGHFLRTHVLIPGLLSIGLALCFLIAAIWLDIGGRKIAWLPGFTAVVLFGVCVAREPLLPALATIVVLFSLFFWTLSGLAFALDRFRFPTTLALVVLLS